MSIKTNSKIISLWLSLALVLGVFVGMPITASAAPIGLSTPNNPHWEEVGNGSLDLTGYAIWDRVPNAVVYVWELFRKDNTGTPQNPDEDESIDTDRVYDSGTGSTMRIDLSSYATKTGYYYFIVCALEVDEAITSPVQWSHSHGYLHYVSNPTPQPPVVNPGGNSDSGSSDSGSSGGSRGTDYTTPSTPSNTPVNVTSSAATTAARSAVEKAKEAGAATATANIRNPGDISLSALQSMAKEAGMPLKLQADSMSEDGKAVEVRITLDPALATGNLNLSASTSNSQAKATTSFFEKYFNNSVMTVSLGQQGSFGQPVTVAAKLDPELKTDNIVLYSYNKETNSYQIIPASNYRVDANGYIHFTTTVGGNIVISDGPLAKK